MSTGDNLYDVIERSKLRSLSAIDELELVYVPSQLLLREIDPDGSMRVADLRAEVMRRARLYGDNCLNEYADFDDIEEALDNYESFYILSGLAHPWGPGAHFKCKCENSSRDCICHHSLMLSLLCRTHKDQKKFEMPALYRQCRVPG